MNEAIKKTINKAITKIIENSSSENKILKIKNTHDVKAHFIPQKYRIFAGILQSMNIQFGNFIEILMTMLIENENKYKIVKEFSGKKSNKFNISKENEILIDEYISKCQIENVNVEEEFEKLKTKIIENKTGNLITFKHDIDILFEDIEENKYYYLECKYNDDHDTGKFIDINRKFIKTYAYLIKELNIEKKGEKELIPILFFFTNKKMKGNIYIPENKNIYRGKRFFDSFLNIKYEEVDMCLSQLSEDKETIEKFHNLYIKIMK